MNENEDSHLVDMQILFRPDYERGLYVAEIVMGGSRYEVATLTAALGEDEAIMDEWRKLIVQAVGKASLAAGAVNFTAKKMR